MAINRTDFDLWRSQLLLDKTSAQHATSLPGAPDGEYVVVIKALKANGNAGNPAHWETWTSPVIAIDRP